MGRVASVSQPPGAAEPDITLTPFAHLGQLAFLQVLIWSPQVTLTLTLTLTLIPQPEPHPDLDPASPR